MKTRKFLFTMIAAMTMMLGLTLTAHAEEVAPATKVVGVEGIGTFTVPADWSDAMYIDNWGTFWFNPAKTAYVKMSTTGDDGTSNPPIDVFAAILKKNYEAVGITFLDWQVTKYFGHDAVYSVAASPVNDDFSTDYPVLHDAVFESGYEYYSGNSINTALSGATTIEEFQSIQSILATYQPAQ